MTKNNKFAAGYLVFASVVLYSFSALAIPSFDAGTFVPTLQGYKSDVENLSVLKKEIANSGQHLAILGDSKGTISQYKAEYGNDIEKTVAAAKKAEERSKQAEAMQAQYQQEIKDRQERYDSLVATASAQDTFGYGKEEDSLPEEEPADAGLDVNNPNGVFPSSYPTITEDPLSANAPVQADRNITSGLKQYGDYSPADLGDEALEDVPASLDGIPLTAEEAAELQASGQMVVDPDAETAPGLEEADVPSAPKFRTSPILQKDLKGSTTMPRLQLRRPLPTAPAEKMSRAVRGGRQEIAFAAITMAEAGSGNSYIGDTFVVASAKLCGIDAEDYLKDDKIRKDCHEKIIRANASSNQDEARNARSDCKKMVFETVSALLAEAAIIKGEAAQYSQEADKQDNLAASVTDTRGDTHVLADSLMRIQKQLNDMKKISSSALILKTTEQLCATSADVLGKEDDAGGGEQ